MKALLVDNSGDKPVMTAGDHPDPKPDKHELLVKIEATALNRADLLQKAGKYPPPDGVTPVLGLEMAGVVESAGQSVTRFKPGDHIFGLLPGGGYAEFCTINEELAIKMPESLSFEEAAAIPEVFLTAWQALVWLGGLQDSETVLIHAGASGVGSAAIQLASRLFNCRVVATTGTGEKLEACRSLGAELAIHYKSENFAERIEESLGENSVDLIIDFVGAPYWEKNIRVTALDGRLIYLSMLGGSRIESVSLVPILRKRLSIKGSTLRNRSESYKAELTRDFCSNTLHQLEEGIIRPVIDSVFDWEDVEEAHLRMKENKNIGKIILTGM